MEVGEYILPERKTIGVIEDLRIDGEEDSLKDGRV
jgi:hypothetical protein